MDSTEITIGDMKNLMAQATLNITSLSKQMGVFEGAISNIQADVNGLKVKQAELTEDLQNTKDDMRITRSQQSRIRKAVADRVNNLLGLEFDGGRVADSSIAMDLKYRSAFMARCYVDAKNKGVMESSYTDTRKRDYDKCIEYIEAWIPDVSGGVVGYKQYLDQRRNAKEVITVNKT